MVMARPRRRRYPSARSAALGLLLLGAAMAPAHSQIADPLLERSETAIAKLAAASVVLTRELMLYDQTLRMRVVRVQLGPSAADAALKSRAEAVTRQKLGQLDRTALRTEQRKEAGLYFAYIEAAIASENARWPTDRSPAAYQALGRGVLSGARLNYDRAMAQGEDPSVALATAYRVLAWSRGATPASAIETPFDSTYDRVRTAMPGLPAQPAPTRVPDFGKSTASVGTLAPALRSAPPPLTASLPPAAPAPQTAVSPPPRIPVIAEATMTVLFEGLCGPADRNRTDAVPDCGSRSECTIETALAKPVENAPRCRREIVIQWSCDTDPARRSLRATPAAGSPPVKLSCRDAGSAARAEAVPAAPRP